MASGKRPLTLIRLLLLLLLLMVSLFFGCGRISAQTFTVDPSAEATSTGILAQPGQVFFVQASGRVNLASTDGPYTTGPDGTILEVPASGLGGDWFFTNNAAPVGVAPVVGQRKYVDYHLTQGFADGLPYGALIACFSSLPNPTSGSDFTGFAVVGVSGTVTAPQSGGYLFFSANDAPNRSDNTGSFTVQVSRSVLLGQSSVELVLADDMIRFPRASSVSMTVIFRNVGDRILSANTLVSGLTVLWDGVPYTINPSRLGKNRGYLVPRKSLRYRLMAADYLIPNSVLTNGRHTIQIQEGLASSEQLTIFIGL